MDNRPPVRRSAAPPPGTQQTPRSGRTPPAGYRPPASSYGRAPAGGRGSARTQRTDKRMPGARPPQAGAPLPGRRPPNNNAQRQAGAPRGTRPGRPNGAPAQRPPQKRRKKRPLTPEQARNRRIRRRILTVMLAIVLIVGAFTVSSIVLFKIKTITVNTRSGELAYSESQILAAFGHSVGENLFGFNVQETQENISKALPYLEDVKVERRLPDTIVITATPAVEQSAIDSSYGWAVLSEKEKVLRMEAQPPEGLIQIVGARADSPLPGQPVKLTEEDKLPILRLLLQKTAAQGLTPLNEIDLTNTLELSIVYQNRIRIVLGTEHDMDYKLDWAWRMVTPGQTNDSLGDAERGTLDVSSRGEDGLGRARWRAGVL